MKDPESLIPPGYLDWVFKRYLPRRTSRDLKREHVLLEQIHDLINKSRVSAEDKEKCTEILRYLMRRIDRDMHEYEPL